MRLCGSDRPGDLSAGVAADFFQSRVAHLGPEFSAEAGVSGCALGEALQLLLLLQEGGALLGDPALEGGGALPRHWRGHRAQGQQQDNNDTLHHAMIRFTLITLDNWGSLVRTTDHC